MEDGRDDDERGFMVIVSERGGMFVVVDACIVEERKRVLIRQFSVVFVRQMQSCFQSLKATSGFLKSSV
jgi:hypothetical protein